MPTNTGVTKLKINTLTEAQYDAAVQSGVIGENEISIITDLDESIQVDTLPTASADELGKICQYVGTTDANYTNGYFYKCVSDGEATPTYSWVQISVQPSPDPLPSQSGNSGKFLVTDGTDPSWSTTIEQGLNVDLTSSNNPYSQTLLKGTYSNKIGTISWSSYDGTLTVSPSFGFAYTFKEHSFVGPSITWNKTLGASDNVWYNVYTTHINNGNDINIPTLAGTMSEQVSTMPTAAATYEGQIYQYTGTTDQNYTNGYFYKCVSDGEATPTYSWTQTDTQPIPDQLPDQTGNSGKFLTTDGTNASWAKTYVKVNEPARTLSVGDSANATGMGSVAINGTAYAGQASGTGSIVIGPANATALGAIQIGGYPSGGYPTNSEQYTFKIALNNVNYKLLDPDGTVPEDRLASITSAVSGQVLQLDSNLDAKWTTISIPTVDQTYNASSTNAQSGVAVAGAISAAISSVYKAAGTVAFANKPSLSSSIEGYVYNISDAFTTTSDFVEGAGDSYPAGTNIVCINTATSGSAVYKWDVLAGFIDLSNYQPLLVSGTNIKTINSNSILGSGNITIDSLPSQTGQSGKFLTTNGTIASWSTVETLPSQSGNSGKVLTTNGSTASWMNSPGATIRIWGENE